MPNATPHTTLLGFDFGMKRIGVAVGQTLTQTATPLTILKAQDGVPNWEEIALLIKTWKADGLVVGIPYNMDGTDQPMTHAARKFAKKCQGRFPLPVHLVDERLTTKAAKQTIKETGNKLPKNIDNYAAKLILESWLQQ